MVISFYMFRTFDPEGLPFLSCPFSLLLASFLSCNMLQSHHGGSVSAKEYLYLNYFARQTHPEIDCSVQMAAAPCAQSVMKVLKLQIIRGPLVVF